MAEKKYMQLQLGGVHSHMFAKVDPEDYVWLNSFSWHYRDGYAIAKRGNKNYRLHRLVMQESNPDVIIDHINRDRLDCRKSNLRRFNPIQNANNRSNNRFIIAFGEKKTIAQWSRDPRCEVSDSILRRRLDKDIQPEWAILAPKGSKV